MATNPKLRIGTVVRHTFSGDEATVLTEPRRVMVGDIYEWWVDIKHRGRREKNVNVEYLELDDVQLSGTVSTASGPLHGSNYNIDGVDTQWVDFDQRTRVVEVTS